MISTIHDATTVNKGRKDRKTNMEIKKPYAVGQYNKFIKGVDRANQYPSYYSVVKKTVKGSKKGSTISAKLCALQQILCVQDTKHKVKYKNFLHEVGRSWISEVQNRSQSSSDNLELPQKGAYRTHQADSPVILEYINLKKLLVVGREKSSILQDSVKCVLHIRSEVKLETSANSALFHFTKCLVLRSTTQ